jgi:hypothetical protein
LWIFIPRTVCPDVQQGASAPPTLVVDMVARRRLTCCLQSEHLTTLSVLQPTQPPIPTSFSKFRSTRVGHPRAGTAAIARQPVLAHDTCMRVCACSCNIAVAASCSPPPAKHRLHRALASLRWTAALMHRPRGPDGLYSSQEVLNHGLRIRFGLAPMKGWSGYGTGATSATTMHAAALRIPLFGCKCTVYDSLTYKYDAYDLCGLFHALDAATDRLESLCTTWRPALQSCQDR